MESKFRNLLTKLTASVDQFEQAVTSSLRTFSDDQKAMLMLSIYQRTVADKADLHSMLAIIGMIKVLNAEATAKEFGDGQVS